VFLFDEPLSNLDAKLRVQMRTEIKALHQRLNDHDVYVTHDQIEAMTLADRIVVMHDGRVEQIGTPLELYDRPANLFVAGFIGSPAMTELGLNAYRFSISWSRILPEGTGRVNEPGWTSTTAGRRRCWRNGIEPLRTLYHWDLPAALDDRGGWLNRDVADWFADYARVMFPRARRPREDVGDAQRAVGGHRRRLPARRARARAPQPVRGADRHAQPDARARRGGAGVPRRGEARDRPGGEPRAQVPGHDSEEDAARHARADAYMNRQYLDPAFSAYPDEMKRDLRRGVAEWPAEDMALIRSRSTSSASTTTRAASRAHPRATARLKARACGSRWRRTRDRAGKSSRRAHRHAGVGEGALRQPPALHHRERRRLLRPAGRDRRRASTTRCAWTTTATTCAPSRRDRPGRGHARLLRLVAARQLLRVVARLLEALRHRARRLRDAAAHAEGQRALLRRRHR
jgi:hypothetical protein